MNVCKVRTQLERFLHLPLINLRVTAFERESAFYYEVAIKCDSGTQRGTIFALLLYTELMVASLQTFDLADFICRDANNYFDEIMTGATV